MRILVTGCSGFLGGSFARGAAQVGHEVLGVGRTIVKSNKHLRTDYSVGDIAGIISRFQPDAILHAAGSSSVAKSFEYPDAGSDAVLTWTNVLEGSRRSGLKPVILYPSSAAVYGNASTIPIKEDAPIRPISPYGLDKVICEMVARKYAEFFDANVIICRLFSIFGANQRRLVTWEIFKQLSSEATVTLYGTGKESRDFLSIDDVIQAFLQLAESYQLQPLTIVNVGSGRETEIAELAGMLRNMIAPDKQIKYGEQHRPGDPTRWCADISSLASLVPKWSPTSLETSLGKCVNEWRSQPRMTNAAEL